MIKKVIKFTDFDGNQQEETAYFNLSKLDVLRLDAKYDGGLQEYANYLMEKKNFSGILELVNDVVLSAYGQKSGTRFIKSDEIRKDFESSLAYESLIDSFLQEPGALADFIAALAPKGFEQTDQGTNTLEALPGGN